MAKGFLYLVVVMDWVSRAVLAWRLSNTLGAEFCVEAYKFGHPEFWTGYRRRFFSEANRIGFIAGVDDQPSGVISAGSLDG
jgi:putative transposase